MAILFEKIRWRNLLSTGNTFTEIDFSGQGTTLIVGDNGSGKSTLLDAITYVLFGRPFRKVNLPQLVNSITKRGLRVEVEFRIGPHEYRVVRGMYPKVFEVYQNEVLINQSADVRDYQEVLEKNILRINYKSFCQVVILGSSLFVPFMQLKTGERRAIIEDLLDLQIFTTMNGLLKDRILGHTEYMSRLQTDQKLVAEKMKLIGEHVAALAGNDVLAIEEKMERVTAANEDIRRKECEYSEQRDRIEVKSKLLVNEEKISKRIDELLHLRHQIEAKLALLNSDISFFSTNDECPTCKQVIDDDFKVTIVGFKKMEVEKIEAGLTQLVQKYDETNAVVQQNMALQSEINDLQMESFRTKNTMDSLVSYRDNLESEVAGIQKQKEERVDTRLPLLSRELKNLNRSYKEATEYRQILAAAGILLRDGGIKARIIKQYVPIINKLVNKYLSTMDFFVQFELDEEFKESIKSRHRDEFTYSLFSEGEKMRIDLALLFTWRAIAKLRSSISTNLLIMDEVVDSSLDQNGTDEFLKILQELTSDTNTFIISHKGDTIADKFAKTIAFKKQHNFSSIVE